MGELRKENSVTVERREENERGKEKSERRVGIKLCLSVKHAVSLSSKPVSRTQYQENMSRRGRYEIVGPLVCGAHSWAPAKYDTMITTYWAFMKWRRCLKRGMVRKSPPPSLAQSRLNIHEGQGSCTIKGGKKLPRLGWRINFTTRPLLQCGSPGRGAPPFFYTHLVESGLVFP